MPCHKYYRLLLLKDYGLKVLLTQFYRYFALLLLVGVQ